jgi:hypothetical protein
MNNTVDTIAEIDNVLSSTLKSWNYVESYTNPYSSVYDKIMALSKTELSNELSSPISELKRDILQKYSIIDMDKKYNLTRVYIEIETKINIILIEKLLIDKKFSSLLSSEWAKVFEENGYEGLYQHVRKETLSIIHNLTEKKLKLLQK